MGAATAVINHRDTEGSRHIRYVQVTMSGSYATGGDTLSKRVELELPTKVDHLELSPNAGYVPEWDAANEKIKVFYADYDAGADGALIEVPNATDLDAVVFRGKAIGY